MTSLIITVYNERKTLPEWLLSITKQTVLPEEIVIVDGGSTDGTWEWLQEQAGQHHFLRVYQKQGNISMGRNEAIKMARGKYIVVTDAGCTYAPDWFAHLASAVQKHQFAATAFGPWFIDTQGLLPTLIAASTTPASKEFQTDWLPSSRSVAFTKDLWQRVGGYPEWLPICEDVVFDNALIAMYGKPYYIREPKVFWLPRPSFSAYLKQLFSYTKSEGHALLNTYRQFIRYGVYGASMLLICASIQISSWYLLGFILAPVYLQKFYRRLFSFSRANTLLGIVLLPFVVFFGDVAKMAGWPVGIIERLRKRIIPE